MSANSTSVALESMAYEQIKSLASVALKGSVGVLFFWPVVRGRGSSSMVEHRLPKPVVAGSIPVSRSRFSARIFRPEPYCPYGPERCGRTTEGVTLVLYAEQRKARKAAPVTA